MTAKAIALVSTLVTGLVVGLVTGLAHSSAPAMPVSMISGQHDSTSLLPMAEGDDLSSQRNPTAKRRQ